MPGVALAPSHNSCSLQMKPFATAAHGTGSPLSCSSISTNKIRIHIIEARKLEGEFVRALVKVAVGNVVKETSTKCGTNNPFWDETLVYNFKEHPQLLMDKAVKFKVLNTRKILKDAVIGSFEFDVGLAYSEPDHCFIHKWLLLTEPHDSTGKPKGFLKISINVLGPGMDATPSPSICSPDNVDIESNLLRPSGAQIQPATLHVRIFEAADLPQMDPAYFNKFKKLFNSQATPKDLVDPYVTLSIAGHHGKTKVIWNDQDPQWNHQLNMAIRFPLFSERIRFQLKDKDQTTTDDLIGTYFMKLSQISPNDLPPTFGPCYINFYGSPREFSDLGDAYEYLNEGVLEGVAYRGRLLVEVTTSVGVLPKEKHEEIKPQYIRAAKPFLKKRKYKLCCAFLGASMIEPFEDTVQFEVSIGNCGNKLDESVCSQMSSTPPLKPMWDGNEYYFLPWMDKKPVVMVDSEWEDCNHRIETANMLENITESLETQLAALKQHAGKKRFEHNLNAFLKSACSELEEAVNWLRPTKPLTESLNPSNALDNLLLDHRHCQLLSAIKELGTIGDSLALVRRKGTAAKVTRNHADYIMECTNIITMIRQLAIEPQNSIPDVIFWMLCDNKRVAYHRIPSHHLMYATRPEGRGRMCGRVQTFFLKPPSLAKEEDLEGAVGRAQMQVVVWLGKEEEHRVWSQNMPGGELAVFAEAVSVTLVSMGKGNLEGGDVDVEGGKGEGGRMEGTASTVQMSSFGPYQYENQTIVGGIWNSTLMLDWPSWSDVTGKISQPLEAFTPPQGWAWAQDWVISPDVSMPLDPDDGKMEWKEESFEIQERFIGGLWQEEASFWTMLKQFADMIRDGWEYSSSKRGPFHMRKSYLDFFRRRRYLRRMTSDDPTALATDKLNFGGSVLLGRGLVLLGHGLVLLGRGLVLLGRGLVLLGCGLVLFGCILRLSGLALEEVRLAWSPEHFSKSFRNPHHKGQKLFPRLYLSFKDEECHQYSYEVTSTRLGTCMESALQGSQTDDDHLGWAFCKPLVRLKQNAPPPELEWTEISRLRNVQGMPCSCVGVVRDMKRFCLMAVNSPCVALECGGASVEVTASPMPQLTLTSQAPDLSSPLTRTFLLRTNPDVQKNGKYDWWTKYYCSISDTVRMQGSYIDEGYDLITVYEHELEKEFNYFEDLLKTFHFTEEESISRDSGQPEEDSDQPIGYLKGYLKVYPSIAARALRLPLIPPPDPITCIVRVYVIKGTDLQAQDVGASQIHTPKAYLWGNSD
eukprot:Em0014g43a